MCAAHDEDHLTPQQASCALYIYINVQSAMFLSLSDLSLQGLCTLYMCHCSHMEHETKGRLHWSILIHIIMHCCSRLLLISSASGGRGGLDSEGLVGNSSLDTYGDTAGCTER